MNRLIVGSVPGLQAADTDYVEAAGGVVVTLPDGNAQAGALRRADDRRQLRPDRAGQRRRTRSRTSTSAPTAAYSVYNWELFYHVPLTVAIHLSRNGRYEEAQRWFHYIFDPTDNSSGPTPERFWKVKPFQQTEVQLIEEVLVNLATGADPELRERHDQQHRRPGRTPRSGRTWSPATGRPRTCSRR